MAEPTLVEAIVPVSERKWIRTFLFSMRIDSPLAGLHAITKFVLVMGVSVALIAMISTADPDPVGCVLLVMLGFVLLWLPYAPQFLLELDCVQSQCGHPHPIRAPDILGLHQHRCIRGHDRLRGYHSGILYLH